MLAWLLWWFIFFGDSLWAGVCVDDVTCRLHAHIYSALHQFFTRVVCCSMQGPHRDGVRDHFVRDLKNLNTCTANVAIVLYSEHIEN